MKKLYSAALLLMLCALLSVSAQAEVFTPGRESCGKADCFWETPMDVSDPDALWRMLVAPMTVLDGDPRAQITVREAPDASSTAVGEVTCMTQGVHLLESTPGGWSRIECYSSSFKGSKVAVWNELVVGYVPTKYITEREVKTKFGLIIDKLTQRLYLFQEGELLDVLAVSTGLGSEDAPWNETRSGEFILGSRSGRFNSEKLICNYGIRYNDGDLLHEVPYVLSASGSKNYGYTEPKLGSRASHGCIRVQRKRTPSGINMSWLWKHLSDQMGTRMVIWEDWTGRQMDVPDDSLALYYIPKTGKSYHAAETCYSVSEKNLPLTAFTYGQLEEKPFDKLNPCIYCYPALRREEIERINEAHRE